MKIEKGEFRKLKKKEKKIHKGYKYVITKEFKIKFNIPDIQKDIYLQNSRESDNPQFESKEKFEYEVTVPVNFLTDGADVAPDCGAL